MDLFATGTAIEKLSDSAEVWAAAEHAFAEAGFPFVIYLTSNGDRSEVTLRTNIPELYEDVPPAQDPFLEYLCNSYDVGRTGEGYIDQHDYLSAEHRAFIHRAAELGFQTGFGLPMRLAGSERFGGFNIGTRLEKRDFECQHLSSVEALRAFCLIVHRRFEELGDEPRPPGEKLSPRETEVMTLIARGLSRKEIARDLNLSPNTVAEYTGAAYRKLGVGNRVEATKAFLRLDPSS